MLHCKSLVQTRTLRAPVRNSGVAALAAEIGRTAAAVSRALSQGKTPDQIRETAKRTDERRVAGKARGKQAGGRQDVPVGPTATAIPKSYVPSRRVLVGSPRAVLVPEAVAAVVVPSVVSATPSAPSAIPGSVEPVLDQNGIETEASATRRKAIALANERELTVAEKRRELLPVKEINVWFAGCIVQARNIFLRIGPELRDRLAAETDPVKCEEMIDVEVRRGLGMLKEMAVG